MAAVSEYDLYSSDEDVVGVEDRSVCEFSLDSANNEVILVPKIPGAERSDAHQ